MFLFCGADFGGGAEFASPGALRRIAPGTVTSAPKPQPAPEQKHDILQLRARSTLFRAEGRLIEFRVAHGRYPLPMSCRDPLELPTRTPNNRPPPKSQRPLALAETPSSLPRAGRRAKDFGRFGRAFSNMGWQLLRAELPARVSESGSWTTRSRSWRRRELVCGL